jgi:hypothetical protein
MTKYLLMTEAEFEALCEAALGADINDPLDVVKVNEAEAACRAREVEEFEFASFAGTYSIWAEVKK